jgi:hypothetical protein
MYQSWERDLRNKSHGNYSDVNASSEEECAVQIMIIPVQLLQREAFSEQF